MPAFCVHPRQPQKNGIKPINRMQNTPTVLIRQHSRKTLLLLSSLLAASLSAQTAADTKPSQQADEDIIKLSPFEITTEKDTGYKASNSIGGTRSNTPIKDIALNIQVFTKDLTDDLVIADQTALERYNAALVNGGADVQSENNIQQAYNSFLFRGFIQNWGMRDGVREYDPIDAQGMARVEIVKGPAAALYGLSYAGGVMNSISKRADMTKNFVNTRFSGFDQGGYRATVDANFTGKLAIGKAGIRYNGASAQTQDKREHSEGSVRYNQVNLELQPLEGTSLQLLVESGWRQKPNGLGYYSRSGTGIGAQTPLQIVHPEIPWTWNWANGSNVRSLSTSLYRFTISQAIGENLHINAYVQNNPRQNIDSNGWDDSGNSQNAAGWDVANWSQHGCVNTGWLTNAQGQEVIRKVYHWRDWKDDDHAQGVTAVYKLETGPVKNTMTAGWAHWDERFTSHKSLQPGTTTEWWDLPIRTGISTAAAPGPSDYLYNNTEGNREHNQNSYYFASWQVSAIDNRLKLNAAVNHTQITNLIWGSVEDLSPYTKVDISKNSPMFGAMFDITKEVSVFAVHSTSIFPTTDKNDFSVQMPPEVGKSNEFGVKCEILNGKISGTVSYYKIKKDGAGVVDQHALNRNKLLWDQYRARDGWVTIDSLGWSHDRDQITRGDGRSGGLGDFVPASLESKGFEADVVIQPIKTLQFVMSYAHNTEESVKGTTKGQSNGGHVKDQAAFLAKYTFDEGSLKGLFVGSGLQVAGKSIADYQTAADGSTVTRYSPSTKYLEFFAGYKFKAFGVNQSVQFNAKNLTKQDDYFGWKNAANASTVARERYAVPTYARFSLTWGIDF
jgi:iron complex outermembrane receptor protein